MWKNNKRIHVAWVEYVDAFASCRFVVAVVVGSALLRPLQIMIWNIRERDIVVFFRICESIPWHAPFLSPFLYPTMRT